MASVTEMIPGINRQRTENGLQRLVIDGVDFGLLEDQRQQLQNAMDNINPVNGWLMLNCDQVHALSGLINMLDSWSDDIFRLQKNHS